MKPKWTAEDERECFRNGWALFDYEGNSVIMKIDDIQGYRYGNPILRYVKNVRHFKSDNGAYAFVKKRAAEGYQT